MTDDDFENPNPLRYIQPEILAGLTHLDLTGRVIFDERGIVARGSYGDIAKGNCGLKDQGVSRVAIKRLRFYLMEDIKLLFEKEIYVWSKLNHHNILPLLGFAFDDSTGYPLLVSEWMANGSAWTFVNKNPKCDLLRLIVGAAAGLNYMHGKGVVHSDVKSDNILVSDSGDGLICDFGCARMISASLSLAKPSDGPKGTTRYLAYELLAQAGSATAYSAKADVWAFGMTVFELLSRERPYQRLREAEVLSAIMRHELPSLPSSLETVEHEVKEPLYRICQRCWESNPDSRIGMADVLAELLTLQGRIEASAPHDEGQIEHQRESQDAG